MYEGRRSEIRPKWPCALPSHVFSIVLKHLHAPLPRFHQSLLVAAISGVDVADNILEWNSVGYFRDACVVAVKEASSSIEPHRALSDKVVHSLLLHGAVRTYLRYVLWSVFV